MFDDVKEAVLDAMPSPTRDPDLGRLWQRSRRRRKTRRVAVSLGVVAVLGGIIAGTSGLVGGSAAPTILGGSSATEPVQSVSGGHVTPGSDSGEVAETEVAPPEDYGIEADPRAVEAIRDETPASIHYVSGPQGRSDTFLFEYRSERQGQAENVFVVSEVIEDDHEYEGYITFLKDRSEGRFEDSARGWPSGTYAAVVDRRPSYYQVIVVNRETFFNIALESEAPGMTWEEHEEEGAQAVYDWARRAADRLSQ